MERHTNPESPDAGRVLAALREARARIEALEGSRFEPLAIVGMGCRFPGGADSPDAFWRLLADGVDAVAEAPRDRWDMDAFYDPDPNAPGKMYTRNGGFLNQVDRFDADFFGISPREAVDLDPQQRLLLEVSWEALEHANLPPRRLSGSRSGVYVGISTFDYAALHLGARDPSKINAYFATGNILCMAAGRLSYTLGFTGPSLAVDTACSSSLVSIHLACQSLRNRECDMALAGGVGLILSPALSINFSRAKMLSPEGKCKTFDAAADGYVRGEGCGVVVLKRLSDALAEGNAVLALIRGSAVNQDGPTAGFTVPSGPSQQRVVREALANAGVTPDQVIYVEAHGTATPLGDPIEMESLGVVFGNRPPENPLLVGSVKTNIGHLEAAAGVAGLIKTVLALQHNRIPPHLHFHTPNPQIDWDRLPVRVPTEGCPWPREKRIAGVSSFGASGTNAHIVLEAGNTRLSADRGAQGKHHPSEQLLVLSAKAENALKQLAKRYREHLTRCPDIPIQDICLTAAAGRIHFDHRLSIIAATTAELCEKLHAFSEGRKTARVFSGAPPISDDQKPRQRIADNWPDLDELARAYVAGAHVDWTRFFMNRDARWTRLPFYPFQRERFWIETEPPVPHQNRQNAVDPVSPSHPLLGNRLRLAGTRQIVYESRMDLRSTAFLEDHIFHDAVVFPVAACVEMAVAAGAALFRTDHLVLEEVIVRKALIFNADEEKILQFCVTPSEPDRGADPISGSALFHLYSLSDQDGAASWTLHMSGTVAAEENPPIPDTVDLRSLQDRCDDARSGESCYRRFQARGIDLGPAFQVIDHLWRGENEALSRIRTPEKLQSEIGRYRLHPVLFDACIQTTGGVLPEDDDATYMPVSIDCVRVDLSSPVLQGRDWSGLWSHIRMRPAEKGGQGMKNDLVLIDEAGAVGVEVEGLSVRKAPREILLRELGKGAHEIPRDWLYEVAWRPTPRGNPQRTPDASEDASDAPGPQSWLIFADRTGLGPRLAEILRARGQRCLLVFDQQTHGPSTAAPETEGVAFIDPGNPSEVREIVRRFATGSPLRGVVHLGSLDGDDSPIAGIHTHLRSILHLTQALVGEPLPGAPGLWIVTRGGQPVASVISDIGQSPVWGLGRVISLEHPEIPCTLIDLDPAGGRDADFTAMARTVFEEVWSPDGEDRIAFRNDLRHTARLVKRGPSLSTVNTGLIRPDASYLITGGMGALGMHTAQWLSDQGARWLALMGRGESSDAARNEIGRLESAGVAVRIIRGDVSQHRETADALERIRVSMPPLRGIVHAAGILDDGLLRQQDMARFKKVLAPKVQGAWNLHALTRDLSLDFFICFSSAASLLGSMGQGAYAAANAFLDALIHYRRIQGLPGLSVNWGPWDGAGMSAGLGNLSGRREDQGIHTLPAKQALHALAQLLREDAIQAAVLPIDWPRYLKRSYRNAPPPLFTELDRPADAEAPAQTAFIRQLAAAAVADRRYLVETMVRRQVAEVLDVKSPEQIEVRRRLFDAGLDSLMAEEITHGLEQSLGHPLRPTLLFDYPTVEAVVEYLLKEVLDSGLPPEETKGTTTEDLLRDASEDEIADLLARELATIEAGKEK